MFIFTYHLKGILQNQFNKILVKRLVGIPTQKVYFVFRILHKKKNGINSNARIYVITIIYIIIA